MKRQTLRRAALAVALVAFVAPAPATRRASAHKFHTSFAEANFNGDMAELEIGLRTFPDDLEAVISKRAGRRVTLADRKEMEQQLTAYLRETFLVKPAREEAGQLILVGVEPSVDTVWVYFQILLTGGIEGVQVSDRFMFDLFDDQVNLLTVKYGHKQAALRFERGDRDFKTIKLK